MLFDWFRLREGAGRLLLFTKGFWFPVVSGFPALRIEQDNVSIGAGRSQGSHAIVAADRELILADAGFVRA